MQLQAIVTVDQNRKLTTVVETWATNQYKKFRRQKNYKTNQNTGNIGLKLENHKTKKAWYSVAGMQIALPDKTLIVIQLKFELAPIKASKRALHWPIAE